MAHCELCKPVLSCCGAEASKHHEHSWERFNKKGVNWFCSNCDADHPRVLRPGLAGRFARCLYCGNTIASDGEAQKLVMYADIPFFEHVPGSNMDRFYCLCRGTD